MFHPVTIYPFDGDGMTPIVTVLGSLNCDVSVVVSQLPVPHQTVTGSTSRLSMGGKGFNQARAAAAAGATVKMIGALGDDRFSQTLREALEAADIDHSHVRRFRGSAAGLAAIVVDGAGNNMIAVAPGANGLLTRQDVTASGDFIAQSDVLLAQLETPICAIVAGLSIARAKGVRTILNPAPVDIAILEHLGLVDVLVPNEPELSLLSGENLASLRSDSSILEKALARLHALGAGLVVATLGERGCVAYDGEVYSYVSAPPTRVVDTTGAGDVFCGWLAATLVRGCALRAALRGACAAASLSVSKASADGIAPTPQEVAALLRAFK